MPSTATIPERAILIRDEQGHPVIPPQQTLPAHVIALTDLLTQAIKRIDDLTAQVAEMALRLNTQTLGGPPHIYPHYNQDTGVVSYPEGQSTTFTLPALPTLPQFTYVPTYTITQTTTNVAGSSSPTLFLAGEHGSETVTYNADDWEVHVQNFNYCSSG